MIKNSNSKLSTIHGDFFFFSLFQLETKVASCGKLEPIHHFGVDKDRFSLTFRLLQVKGLPSWANTSSVSIEDVIEVILIYLYLIIIRKMQRNEHFHNGFYCISYSYKQMLIHIYIYLCQLCNNFCFYLMFST